MGFVFGRVIFPAFQVLANIMKIFLDDIRHPPDNTWTVVRTYDEFIELLDRIVQRGEAIEIISFDHDLGDNDDAVKNGYRAMCAVEMLVAENRVCVYDTKIHSANPSVRHKMEQTSNSIKRMVHRNLLNGN